MTTLVPTLAQYAYGRSKRRLQASVGAPRGGTRRGNGKLKLDAHALDLERLRTHARACGLRPQRAGRGQPGHARKKHHSQLFMFMLLVRVLLMLVWCIARLAASSKAASGAAVEQEWEVGGCDFVTTSVGDATAIIIPCITVAVDITIAQLNTGVP